MYNTIASSLQNTVCSPTLAVRFAVPTSRTSIRMTWMRRTRGFSTRPSRCSIALRKWAAMRFRRSTWNDYKQRWNNWETIIALRIRTEIYSRFVVVVVRYREGFFCFGITVLPVWISTSWMLGFYMLAIFYKRRSVDLFSCMVLYACACVILCG